MRNSWTDERLDDGFDRVTADIAVLRGEVGSLRTEVGSLRKEMHEEIGSLRTEFKAELKTEIGSVREEIGMLREDNKILFQEMRSLQRTLLRGAGGIIVALIGVIVTQL